MSSRDGGIMYCSAVTLPVIWNLPPKTLTLSLPPFVLYMMFLITYPPDCVPALPGTLGSALIAASESCQECTAVCVTSLPPPLHTKDPDLFLTEKTVLVSFVVTNQDQKGQIDQTPSFQHHRLGRIGESSGGWCEEQYDLTEVQT